MNKKYYKKLNPDKLVLFDHGIGAGHLAYFKEIVCLLNAGYTVCSFDHLGCGESGGKGLSSLSQSIRDLDDVLTSLEQMKEFKGKNIKLCGHSMGGYAVENAGPLHKNVTHIVSLAGFLSVEGLLKQHLPGFLIKDILENERNLNKRYVDMDACDNLKKTDAKFLYIQSRDDSKLKFNKCYNILKKALNGRKNTFFVELSNHGHNPQYTKESVKALNKMEKKLLKLQKKNKLNDTYTREEFKKSFDWDFITHQDEKVWNQILKFLNS